MEAWVWVVVVLVLLVVLVLVGLQIQRSRRRAQLRERFGPEYDEALRRTADRREAEQLLTEVSHRRDQLEIRDLPPESRARYVSEWDATQARFVDEPGRAVAEADALVTAVLRERGYPIEDFDDSAALVATDHPDVVRHYRSAHEAYAKHRSSGAVDTEDLRQAFVHYRSLFHVLTDSTS